MSPEDETSAKAEIDSEVVEALGFEPMSGGGRRRGSITEQISEAGFAITDVLEPKVDSPPSGRNGSAYESGNRRTKRSRRRRRNNPGSGPAVPASTEDDELEADLLQQEGLVAETSTAEAVVDSAGNGAEATAEAPVEEAVVDSGNGSGADSEQLHEPGMVVVETEIPDGDSAEEQANQPVSDGPVSNDRRSDTRLQSTDNGEHVEVSVDVDGESPANATVEMSAVESAMVTPTQVDRSGGDGIVVDGPVDQPHHVGPVPSTPPSTPPQTAVGSVPSTPPQTAVAEAPPIVAEGPPVTESPPIAPEGPPVIEAPSSPAITGPQPVIRINEAEGRRGIVERQPSLGGLFSGWPGRRRRLEARKVRRVVRHIDPWSVLTFSVLFHLCVFAALLLASVLVWNVAQEAGTIENLENFILELGDYETFDIDGEAIFRAALAIAGIFTLAASVLMVLLTVMFNLLSDLIGGIRVTVIEEETVRIQPKDD